MSVPARVAAEAAQADIQLAELAAAAKAAKEPTPPPAEPPVAAVPPVEPAPPVPAPVPPVQPVPDAAAELRRINQQLSTLQGRFETTLADNAVLRGRVEELGRQPPAPTPAPAPTPELVTAKDREEYGDDLIGLIGRVFQQQLGSRFDDLGNRLAGLEGRLGNAVQQVQSVHQVTRQTVVDKYLADLYREIPDWEAINDSTEFVDWLGKKDILTGSTYFTLLEDAHKRANSETVIHIFQLYKQEKGIGTPAPTPAPPAPPGSPSALIDPNTLAAPPTSPSAPPPATPPAGHLWSKDEVDKLYEDKRKGRITNTEFDQREKEYFKALAEGRVSTT